MNNKHRLQRFALVIALCIALGALATVVGASPPQQDQSQTAIPPSIAETVPFLGEELLLDQTITLYFDQAMDRASVEAALSVTPAAVSLGDLTWTDDLTLTVAPQGTWTRNAEVVLTLATSASTADGVPLADPISLTFQTIGFLEVTELIPADGLQEVDSDSVITVMFNRPVVPLVTIEEQADLPNPLSFDPPLAGEGEWLNTSIYIFRPDEGIPGGITQSVTVAGGLTDGTGAILEEDVTWSFSTLNPRVTGITPRDGSTGIALDRDVTVSFSQAMNPVTTAEAFRVRDMVGRENVLGEIEWSENFRTLTFTPDNLMQLDRRHQVTVNALAATSATGASIEETWQSDFFTVPYPAIEGTAPGNGDAAAYPYGGFEIFFNAPVDIETIEGKITIQPEPWREYDTYYYDYNDRYSLFFDTEPSTDYTVIILPGIADRYGNTIDEQLVVQYTTDSYSPEINLNAPSFVGIYSAHNANTRVFATHRNVSRLNIELYDMTPFVLARFLGDNRHNFRDSWTPLERDLVRQWSIDVQSQPNSRRYELLLLSEQGGDGIDNIQCLGAPPPRLQIGDLGMVSLDDPSPLRVRGLPNLQGEVLNEIDPGVRFFVDGGPICADGYIWWNITVEGSDITGWSAEGTTENYFVETLERNGPVLTDIDPEDFPALPPGAYYLTMTAPETAARDHSPLEHIAVVSTVNITFKYSPNEALAWVTDMQTGLPVADITVNFFDGDFGLLGRMNTNEDGVVMLRIPHLRDLYTTLFATVETDEQFGIANSGWDGGLSPFRFNVNADYSPADSTTYLHTDRPIYRPGQPVYFRGVLRDRDDVNFTLPAGINRVPVEILDPERQVVYEESLTLTEHGTFSGTFTLDEGAALGSYRIQVDINSEYSVGNALRFNVAEFVAPEFQVNATPALDAVVQGETVDVEVESSFFFGGAVSNADVEWSVLTRNYYFNYTGAGRYDFIEFNYDSGPGEFYDTYGELIAEGTGTTDDEGKFIVSLPADLGTRTQSQEYTIEARVIDESDQLVASRAQVIVHQGEVYVGLQPEQYIGQAEQETGVGLVIVDWASEPVENQVVEYEVVERVWSSVQEEDEVGRTIWTWEVEEIPISDGTLATDAEGLARIAYTPPNAGTYKIYATTRDSLGNEIETSTFMWVSGTDFVAWRQQNSNRVDLITNADSYKVGETAEILIASPFQGETSALVTVERGGIVSHEVIRMSSNSEVFTLPITPEFAPNIFVSVVLMKGVDENNAFAEFRMGMVQLDVDTEQLALHIDVTPNVDVDAGEFAGPGDEVTYTIRTTDWQDQPVSAEVGVGVTDLSVLTITSPNSGTQMSRFYSERGVSVRTSTGLTVSVDKATQTIIDTVKGGGGGGADAGIFEIREEFVDTPGWEPSLVTDENGEATFTLTLPDNLTTWRLDARGITDGVDRAMLVGENTFDLLSTKPLLVRPLTPRFLIVEDVVELGAIVNNNTSTTQSVEISMQGTGFVLEDGQELTQVVDIPSKGRQRVNWRVRVLDTSEVDLTFFANGNDGEFTDASKPTATQGEPLPVYRYEVPETVGTGGALVSDGNLSQSELVVLPRRFDVTEGELTIKVDRSLAAATLDGLNYLRNYPHQCTEQTVSRFMPNVITARALAELDLLDPDLQANLDREVGFALQRLFATQHVDGGWGWFPENNSSPLVTAYALLGLSIAQEGGYAISQSVLDDAAEYVQENINTLNPTAQTAHWRLNRQAFLIYAMTRSGYPQPSEASVLFDLRTSMNLDARAYLALAMHIINPADARLPVFVSDFVGEAILSATGAHWEDSRDYYNWTTNTRSTALVMDALIQIAPDNQLIPQVVRWLMVARTADAWESTQETVWAVMALTDWMVETGELRPDYTFAVGLNGREQNIADNTATADNVKDREVLRIEVADLLKDEANRLTFARSEGDGNLYYTAHLTAYLPVPEVEAASRGIIVDRKYYAIGDESRTPISSGQVGDNVEVVVTIIAPSNLHYVVIEDPIPAGAAAINPGLDINSVVTQGPDLSRTLSRGGWGWWYFARTEFRDEKVVMYADFLPRGSYEFRYTMRLGLAGDYNVIPPTGQEFYFPEVYGRGDGLLFSIAAGEEE